jgi:hypothetical protein
MVERFNRKDIYKVIGMVHAPSSGMYPSPNSISIADPTPQTSRELDGVWRAGRLRNEGGYYRQNADVYYYSPMTMALLTDSLFQSQHRSLTRRLPRTCAMISLCSPRFDQ